MFRSCDFEGAVGDGKATGAILDHGCVNGANDMFSADL